MEKKHKIDGDKARDCWRYSTRLLEIKHEIIGETVTRTAEEIGTRSKEKVGSVKRIVEIVRLSQEIIEFGAVIMVLENHFNVIGNTRSIEAEVYSFQQCEKCQQLLSHNIQQHFLSHPDQNIIGCSLCYDNNFLLSILHFSSHIKLIEVIKPDQSDKNQSIVKTVPTLFLKLSITTF